jgi:co-chaperonin GroES (HSP10)
VESGVRLRPLRGRVAVKPLVETRTGLIWHPDQRPDTERSEDRQLGKLAQSSHRGRVLGAGPPALRHGHEVPLGFEVGDEVVFVFASRGTEESRRSFYGDEPCVWVAQEEVIAVVSP